MVVFVVCLRLKTQSRLIKRESHNNNNESYKYNLNMQTFSFIIVKCNLNLIESCRRKQKPLVLTLS